MKHNEFTMTLSRTHREQAIIVSRKRDLFTAKLWYDSWSLYYKGYIYPSLLKYVFTMAYISAKKISIIFSSPFLERAEVKIMRFWLHYSQPKIAKLKVVECSNLPAQVSEYTRYTKMYRSSHESITANERERKHAEALKRAYKCFMQYCLQKQVPHILECLTRRPKKSS